VRRWAKLVASLARGRRSTRRFCPGQSGRGQLAVEAGEDHADAELERRVGFLAAEFSVAGRLAGQERDQQERRLDPSRRSTPILGLDR
jgi:hypothetical protein